MKAVMLKNSSADFILLHYFSLIENKGWILLFSIQWLSREMFLIA